MTIITDGMGKGQLLVTERYGRVSDFVPVVITLGRASLIGEPDIVRTNIPTSVYRILLSMSRWNYGY